MAPRVVQGCPVVLSSQDLQFVSELAQQSVVAIEGMVVNVERKLPTSQVTLAPYRVKAFPQSQIYIQVLLWANRPPGPPGTDVFGEVGDLWISVQQNSLSTSQIYVRTQATTWLAIRNSLTTQVNTHPLFPNRALTLRNGRLAWYTLSAARDSRSKLTSAGVEASNDRLVNALYFAMLAHLQTRAATEDPSIFSCINEGPSKYSDIDNKSIDDYPLHTPEKLLEALRAETPSHMLTDNHLISQVDTTSFGPPIETCLWWNQVRTILPFVVDSSRNGREETPDLRWTRWASSVSVSATMCLASDVPSPVHIIDLPDHTPNDALRVSIVQTIRDTLAQGRCVCVKPFRDTNGWTWSEHTFEMLTGSLDAPVDWVDAATRRDEFRNPASDGDTPHFHESGTVRKFLAKCSQPNASVNLMDIPLFSAQRPWFVEEVSDDTLALRATRKTGYAATHIAEHEGPLLFPADMSRLGAWALAMSGGFWTDFHHDSNGAATWVTVSTGAKIWVLLTPRSNDPQAVLKSFYKAATLHQKDDPSELEKHFYVTSILLEPGSVLIQPPGQLHAVYTPVKTIMHGGHILLYNTLHQTLFTRRLEYLTNHCATNASHPAIDRLVARMVLALPYRSGSDFSIIHLRVLEELLLYGLGLYTTSPQEGKKKKRTGNSRNDDEDYRERCSALQVLRDICHQRHLPFPSPDIVELSFALPLTSYKLNLPTLELIGELDKGCLDRVRKEEEEGLIPLQKALDDCYHWLNSSTEDMSL